VEGVEGRARKLLALLPAAAAAELRPEVEPAAAQAGSGTLPLEELPSWAVALRPGAGGVEELARRLRLGKMPVVGRISQERLLLDMRTVRDDEVETVAAALVRAAQIRD